MDPWQQFDPAFFQQFIPSLAQLLNPMQNALQSLPTAATVEAALQSNGNIAEIQPILLSVGNKLQEISTSVDKVTADSAKETIDKLEIAMTKIFKVAVFIRGNYDDRDPDEPQKEELLRQAVQAFQEVEDCSDAALKKIGEFHAQVVEIENSTIIPTKAKISLMLEQNTNTLRSVQDQLNTAQSTAQTLQQSLEIQTQAVRSLQSKIADTQDAKLFSDIGFTILTLGIGNAINGGPLDPAHLQDQLDDARNSLNDAQNNLQKANSDLWALQAQRAQLEAKLSNEQKIAASLPQLQATSESTESRCVMLQRQFAPVKETASKLLIKVREVQDGVVVTSAIAYTKKEFATGLLEICSDCLMDSRLTDEAEMVRDEIVKEYGGEVPGEITEAAATVSERVQLIGTIPGIKGI